MTDRSDRWRDHARCAGEPMNRFFTGGSDTPEGYSNKAELEALRREFCWTCPVRAECLRDGLTEEYGVRGGLPEDDRKQIVQLDCHCGAPIDPKDMLDRNRRHFCADHIPIVFDRTVSFGA